MIEKCTPVDKYKQKIHANMTLENPKIVFPEVTLNYEEIPELSLVDDFEISNQEIKLCIMQIFFV